ncbi:MAG: bifunctional 5,10-methylene-tetrahydrofolate dehydrogenase/5,10-methylene-tetrahydrofolate cyclohydrolase [Gammaproteobacteria bacterium]|jgi:methylenetetrahydrofolate dehydrogenase (NADP+)/methenyltetrahydrofolate cyclohydrolase|nr:bifunctional 5,10-methylene-tetrahydrofolate dehydrogenase/5,10-methylene-tetrahydrofolate cyclohydrolase [Gammaproteobacteria bacterium]MCH2578151.1 bifunctional methylenetetrahydrofolate dehydrogenase/methenyltetrahydrofolate cyclohydrolase [Pseudomonadales bacterium]MEC7765969.1 tetrahydrofolate dehydrogenase/cyclohydrolase catalytic domain-containing protein [Pseudomonadota bacterium]MED5385620.1 tetrahydrofolate dehydrogenase/cyclohydrolase catalytic domain-containing protein [Pseudomona|tara:strand:+ start:1124 stop:1996 length:873 start_codon:yes stop_codon:yes gene_type:complete
MELLDGKLCSEQIRREIKEEVDTIKTSGKRPPHLAAILVGDDGASQNYVSMKVKDCEEVGFGSTLIQFDANVSEEELLNKIAELNADNTIDGFIVQLPLPDHIDDNKVILAIDPKKDVDGFCPENIGKLCLGLPTFVSATPNGIMELLRRYQIKTEGKHCVVLGRSNIVGTPIAILMSRNNDTGNATVTIAHSRTKNLKEICRSADILIVAIGKTKFVTADMVKEGAVVIDVGQTRVPDKSRESGFRNVGDVDFDTVKDKCSFITYVTGGVGPMTRASLLQNTLIANQRR